MVQTFVEKNRRLLLFYYWAARVGGWFLLSLSLLAVIGHSIALASRVTDWQEFLRYWNHDVPWGMITFDVPAGILAIGIAQLLYYFLEPDRRPGWILRNADKFLYAYTAILLSYYIWMIVKDLSVTITWDTPAEFVIRIVLYVITIFVKILALVGIAQFLNRMLPMLEESKSLV